MAATGVAAEAIDVAAFDACPASFITPEPRRPPMSPSVFAMAEAEADRAFEALAKDGQIQMPIGKTFFSPRVGCVADKFGVSWMVMVPQPM